MMENEKLEMIAKMLSAAVVRTFKGLDLFVGYRNKFSKSQIEYMEKYFDVIADEIERGNDGK